MFWSKSGSNLTGILSFGTGDLSPVSWLGFSCLENFFNLSIPIGIGTVGNLDSVGLAPESIITPITSITTSSSIPTPSAITIPKWLYPFWFSEGNFTDKILTWILFDLLSLYKIRISSITSGVFSILCDFSCIDHND